MINILVGGESVSYEALDDVRNGATQGLAFWRETLESCTRDENAWNDLLNELWQSGSEYTAELLGIIHETSARQRWLLSAIVLSGLADENFIDAVKNISHNNAADLLNWLSVVREKIHNDADVHLIAVEICFWERRIPSPSRECSQSVQGSLTEDAANVKCQVTEVVDGCEMHDSEMSSIRATLKEEYTSELADVLMSF